MRIQVLLNEESMPERKVHFDQLTDEQIYLLKKINAGRMDIEALEFEKLNDLDELMTLGLIDDDYGLTERGRKAVAISRIHDQRNLDSVRQKQDGARAFDRNNSENQYTDYERDMGIQDGKTLLPKSKEDDEFEFEFGDGNEFDDADDNSFDDDLPMR